MGNMLYMIKGPKFIHERHVKQMRKRYPDAVRDNPPAEDILDIVFDTFEIPAPVPKIAQETRRPKKEKKIY